MFRFHEGQKVSIKEDRPAGGIRAGDIGKIWALYDTNPVHYEVTFRASDGRDVDITLGENELDAVPPQARSRRRAARARVKAA